MNMEYKRRITIAILLIVILMSAQNIVYGHKMDYTSHKAHLTFDGVSINGHYQSFLEKLKKKGYKTKTRSVEEGETYQYLTGRYAGIDGWEIYIDSDDDFKDSIYSVRLYREYASYLTQNERYEQVKEFIKSNYKVIGTVKLNGGLSYAQEAETIYNIGNKGTIKVEFISADNGENLIGITFTDKENEKKYGFHPFIKKYELKNVSNNFQRCLIESSDLEIKYSIIDNNHTYTFVSRGNDKQQIKQLLEGKYSNLMKIYILTNYINFGLEECKRENAILILKDECESICQQYLAMTKKSNNKRTQITTPKEALLEMLRQKIFSPSEREVLDKVVPPEMMRQMMGGVLNVMGSSSDSHYTDYEKYINPYLHD